MTATVSDAVSMMNARPAASVSPVRNRDSLLKRYLTPAPTFTMVSRGHEERELAEQFVSDKYKAFYQAQISHFLPCLLTMHCLGSISGVAGIRPADQTPMFLEQYLPAPVEQVLADNAGHPVLRSQIAEIGNLAAGQRGASHLLFLLFTAVLHRAGFRWITFTATRALRNNLDKLGFPLQVLAEADLESIPEQERAAWGSYYDTDPKVVAGSLQDAMDIIQSRPLLRRVLRLYRYQINYLAEELGG